MSNKTSLTTSLDDLHDEEQNISDSPADKGEESVSGSATSPDSDDDVLESISQITGEEPQVGKPFSLAEEIEKDEYKRRGIDPNDLDYED